MLSSVEHETSFITAEPDQGKHGLLTGISMQSTIKMKKKNHKNPLKLEMDSS